MIFIWLKIDQYLTGLVAAVVIEFARIEMDG